MSRLQQITDDAADQKARNLFDGIKKKVGGVPNLYRVFANSPASLAGHLALSEALGAGGFDPQTREAIALTVANANGCDYCASAHTAISKSLKVDDAEISRRLGAQSSDARLQAILQLAKAVVETRGLASDADLAAARAAGLSDGDIVETVTNVAANILTNYVNHVADTEIDFPLVRTTAQAA